MGVRGSEFGIRKVPFCSDDSLRSRMSPLDSYRKNMKFEYNIDPVRRLVNFSPVGRSGIGPEKCRFAECGIFRNWILICEVREIISKIDSRKSRFGVRKATRERPKVIQVRTRVSQLLRFDPGFGFERGLCRWKGGEKL